MIAHSNPPAEEPRHAPVGRRSAARLRLAIPARFVSILATQSGILLDVSRSGARLGLAQPPPEGQAGYLAIDRFEVFGTIVRTEPGIGGGIIGIDFEEPLTDAQVLEIRRHAEQFETNERQALRDQVRRWVSGEP